MDKEETTAPIPEEEKGGGDGGYGECVPHDGGEQFENLNTPVSNELLVKRNNRPKDIFRPNSQRNDQNYNETILVLKRT